MVQDCVDQAVGGHMSEHTNVRGQLSHSFIPFHNFWSADNVRLCVQFQHSIYDGIIAAVYVFFGVSCQWSVHLCGVGAALRDEQLEEQPLLTKRRPLDEYMQGKTGRVTLVLPDMQGKTGRVTLVLVLPPLRTGNLHRAVWSRKSLPRDVKPQQPHSAHKARGTSHYVQCNYVCKNVFWTRRVCATKIRTAVCPQSRSGRRGHR